MAHKHIIQIIPSETCKKRNDDLNTATEEHRNTDPQRIWVLGREGHI